MSVLLEVRHDQRRTLSPTTDRTTSFKLFRVMPVFPLRCAAMDSATIPKCSVRETLLHRFDQPLVRHGLFQNAWDILLKLLDVHQPKIVRSHCNCSRSA